jgi:hypothetical protein
MNWIYNKYQEYQEFQKYNDLLYNVKANNLGRTKDIIENGKQRQKVRQAIYNVIDQHKYLNLQFDYHPTLNYMDNYMDKNIDHSLIKPNTQDYNMLKILLSDKSVPLKETMLPAVYRGDLPIIDLLLKDGRFNPGETCVASSNKPTTALELAKYYNRNDIVERLLQDPRTTC